MTAYSQDSGPDTDRSQTDRTETAEQTATLEHCANVPGAIDVSVLDDRHVYIRTRGSNHYLLTTEQCERMHRSYLRQEVQLVPYGRRVCQSDGSYLLYVDGGRPRTCNIQQVQRVDSRNAARELAAGPSAGVRYETVDLDPEQQDDGAEASASPR